uniref:Reverse transcriptase domain-containing protein n=1 Tax=Lactuca sativa TaxID=4236 RepID=A0A9R1WDF2_LACSA|nr:hypothetical protein LSAT_V11C200078940 [Lactuca sativa]
MKFTLLIFKADFEKVFDSLNWSFLDSILEKMSWLMVLLRRSLISKEMLGNVIFYPLPFHYFYRRILRCFYRVFDLKVDPAKSKVFGIKLDNSEIDRLASILHCDPATFLFIYLGLPIGSNMKLARNWNPILVKFKSKLSSGKRGHFFQPSSYYISMLKNSKKIIELLEGIRRNFLKGGLENKRNIH